ncbi:MAG: SPOR domain-containing protein [Bacteroidales bacterium]|nr:SPOR domain-containing protein [Bacteroidales bacterium]
MRIFLSILGLLISHLFFAQASENSTPQLNIFSTLTQQIPQQGKVSIVQDKSIEQLTLRYIAYRSSSAQLSGFRIRIFSASGSSARSRAYHERDRFASLYPKYPIYLEYEAPNFKVYIGDFRNRHEAFRVFKQISSEFKNAFVVPSAINLPKID